MIFILVLLNHEHSRKNRTYRQKNQQDSRITWHETRSTAQVLGISQQSVRVIENSEEVEQTMLERIATALEVSVEGIKHFTEEAVFNNINNFHDQSIQNNFNPIEKVVEH